MPGAYSVRWGFALYGGGSPPTANAHCNECADGDTLTEQKSSIPTQGTVLRRSIFLSKIWNDWSPSICRGLTPYVGGLLCTVGARLPPPTLTVTNVRMGTSPIPTQEIFYRWC